MVYLEAFHGNLKACLLAVSSLLVSFKSFFEIHFQSIFLSKLRILF